MKRNTNYEFFIISLTGFSVFLILFQYYYDPLGQALVALFVFDLSYPLFCQLTLL